MATASQVTSLNLEGKGFEDWKQVAAEVKNYPNLQMLSLKQNDLTKINKDIHKLKKLRFLDISANPVAGVKDVLEGLMGLPLLRELKIDLRSKDDEYLLLQALPKLHTLNGVKIGGGDAGNQDEPTKQPRPQRGSQGSLQDDPEVDPTKDNQRNIEEAAKIKNEDLERVAALFDMVRLIIVEKDKSQKNELGKQMEDHIKKIMVDLGLTVKDYMHPLIKATHNLKARFALIEPPFIKAIELAGQLDPRITGVLEEVHDIHTSLFKNLIDIIFDLEPKTNKLYANYRERNLKAYEEANSAIGVSDQLYKENQELINRLEEEKNNWTAERTRLMKEISGLEAENKKYLTMILKHSKSR